VTIARVASTSLMCSDNTSQVSKNSALRCRDREAVDCGALARCHSCPDEHPHAEGLPVTGNGPADAAIAVDAERLAAQRVADADLPAPGAQRGDLLRDLPHRREDQAEGQFRGGVRRRAGMLVRRDDDAVRGAGVDVDMWIDAALTDQPQRRKPFDERRADLRAFAKQDQHLGIGEALGERIDLVDMVVPDRDLVAVELAKAIERAQRVEPVVEDGDLHGAANGPYAGQTNAILPHLIAP